MRRWKMVKRILATAILSVLAVSVIGSIHVWAAQPKQVTIRYFNWAPPPPNPFTRNQAWFWNQVQEKSQGRIKMEYFWGGTLAPPREAMSALKQGIGDAALTMASYHPGQMPLSGVGSLVVSGDLWATSMATIDLSKNKAIQDELARWDCKYAAPISTGPYWVLTKKPVKKLDDLKGLKIRALGEEAKFLAALGAVPVTMPYPEIHEALGKGTIDGTDSNWVTCNIYKLYEVAKYMYMVQLGSGGYFMSITLRTWNKLSSKDQATITGLAEAQANHYAEDYWIKGNKAGKKVADAAGVQVTPITAADAARAKEVVKPIWASWAKAREKNGLPGKAILDLWIKSVQKYEAKSPYKDIVNKGF